MKKNKSFFAVLLVLIASLLVSASVFAEPETIPIKTEERKARERLAAQNVRKIQINQIQDPVAREAIREILRYLKLSSAAN